MLRSRLSFSGLLALSALAVLAGCGGGGGSVPAATPISTFVSTPTPSAIVQAVSKISLTVDKPTAQPGTSVRLTAALTDAAYKPLANRSVTFSLDDTPITSATTDDTGQAAASYALPLTQALKTVTMKAHFAGDAANAACQASAPLTVSGPATSLSLLSDKSSVSIGQSVTLTAVLTWAQGALAGKPIAFALGGTPIGTANTDAITGKATFIYTLAAGTPFGAATLTAAFAGDAGLASSSASAPVTVLTPTRLTATPDTVTTTGTTTFFNINAVLLDVNGRPLASEKVYASSSGLSVSGSAFTDVNGKANLLVQVYYPPGHRQPVPHGTHVSHVNFDGDARYTATSTTLTIIVP